MSSSAMFTAVTGATAQQFRIDVIANNLANLGTVGFKRMTPQFEDLLYETITPPTAEGGSPTGLQFGRGVRIVSTDHVYTQGGLRTTDQPLHMAVEGDGFFAIQRLNGDIAYTRHGAFRRDANGDLVTPTGLLLDPPINVPEGARGVDVQSDGRVFAILQGGTTPTQLGQVQLTRFPNPGGLEAVGGNLLIETAASGPPETGNPGDASFGTLNGGALEESNVNIAEELVALIVAQRAFEANTRVISASDDMLRFVTQQ